MTDPSFHGVLVEDAPAPGSPGWLRLVSASKVAAMAGVSRWDSPVSLWLKMTGRVESDSGSSAATERGTYLEPAILGWFADQHPELTVTEGATYRHPEVEVWTAAPDGWAIRPDGTREGIECKTAAFRDDWGAPGTAEIPPAYLVQTTWQMIVTGVRTVWVPVCFGSPFRFELFRVTWDDVAGAVPQILDAVEDFEQCVALDVRPAWDGAEATYQAVRRLHPAIDVDAPPVPIPAELAARWAKARQGLSAAEEAERAAKTEVLDLMGTARAGVLEGTDTKIATRKVRGQGHPWIEATANLKKLIDSESENA